MCFIFSVINTTRTRRRSIYERYRARPNKCVILTQYPRAYITFYDRLSRSCYNYDNYARPVICDRRAAGLAGTPFAIAFKFELSRPRRPRTCVLFRGETHPGETADRAREENESRGGTKNKTVSPPVMEGKMNGKRARGRPR